MRAGLWDSCDTPLASVQACTLRKIRAMYHNACCSALKGIGSPYAGKDKRQAGGRPFLEAQRAGRHGRFVATPTATRDMTRSRDPIGISLFGPPGGIFARDPSEIAKCMPPPARNFSAPHPPSRA